MLLSQIIKRVNRLVGNSSSFALTYNQLEQYIDSAVDHINFELKTNMLTPSDDWFYHEDIYKIIYSKKFLGTYNQLESSFQPKEGDMYYNSYSEQYLIYTSGNWEEIFVNEDDTGALVPSLTIEQANYNYKCMPDDIIRSILVYAIAAFYLEEEDELESQYRTYMSKVEEGLADVKRIYYSCYDTAQKEEKQEPTNPYWIGDDD
jgi:hypothetical protein